MSDFDKFFADRLEEEAQFPNKNRNWRGLSKRLDALDMGQLTHRPRLRIWQGVAAASVITCGFLIWKTFVHQAEIKSLHHEIAELTQSLQAMQSEKPVPIAGNAENVASGNHPGAISPNSSSGNSAQPTFTPPASNHSEPNPGKNNVDYKEITYTKNTSKIKSPESPSQDAPTRQHTPEQNVQSGTADSKQEQSPKDAPATIPAVEPAHVANDSMMEVGHMALSDPGKQDASATADSVQEHIPSQPKESSEPAPVKQDAAVVQAKDAPPKDEAAPAKIIKPAAEHSRLRAGPYILAGFVQPKQPGVSTISGQGIEASFRVWQTLRVQASAEWLHFNISSTIFPERFYPHHDTIPRPPDHNMGGPGGGMHHQDLVQVESSQRHQQFGLGLQYTLPVNWWVKPVANIAYNVIRVAPTLVTYKFTDENHMPGHDPDPDEYVAEKIDKQWITRQMRFGIGVEKSVHRWVFGINADYTKSFADTTPAFNTLYIRAGIQYQM